MKIRIDRQKLLEYGFENTGDMFYHDEKAYGISYLELDKEIEVVKMDEADEYTRELFSDDTDLDLYCKETEMAYSTLWVE